MRRKTVPILILLLFFTAACAKTGAVTTSGADQDFITNSYNALDLGGKSVDRAMTAIGMLYKAGQFSSSDKAMAVQAYSTFQTSYNRAVDALTVYSVTPSPANKTAVTAALVDVGVQVAAVVALSIIQAK